MIPTRLQHPRDPEVFAQLGYDHALGFFIEVYGLAGKRLPLTYDAVGEDYDRERPLLGGLNFLVKHGFYTAGQLEHALDRREVGGRKPRAKGALLALRAVAALKDAAAL